MRTVLTAEIDARPLAVARILAGLASFYLEFEWLVPLFKIGQGTALRMPVISWLPAPNVDFVVCLLMAAVLGSVGMVLGVTRWPALVVSAASVVALLLDWQTYSNHLVLLALLSLYLGLSGSHRAWSVLHRRGGERVPYWPAFLLQAQISTLYFWAGVSKISDQYLSGDVLRMNLHEWVPLPDRLLPAVAVASIGTEIVLSVILWVRPLFPLALLLGAGLHIGIAVLLTDPNALIAFGALMAAGYGVFGHLWWIDRTGHSTSKWSIRIGR